MARETVAVLGDGGLPGRHIPDGVHVTADDRAALDGATLVVVAVPTQYIRATLAGLGYT